MKRTFQSEDHRKTQLFEAWNRSLQQTTPSSSDHQPVEGYEGIGIVHRVQKNSLTLLLDDGTREDLAITRAISELSQVLDGLYLVMSQGDDRVWQALQLHSIGSRVGQQGVHVTLNPLLVDAVNRLRPTPMHH